MTVNDVGGSSTTITGSTMVADPAVVQASAVVFNATAGAPQSGNLATFTDPGGAEPNPSDPSGTIANHYTVASINWGDGTPLDTTTGAITYGGSPGGPRRTPSRLAAPTPTPPRGPTPSS